MLGIVEYFAQNQDTFTAVAGPGQWNDPDQVGLSHRKKSLAEPYSDFCSITWFDDF